MTTLSAKRKPSEINQTNKKFQDEWVVVAVVDVEISHVASMTILISNFVKSRLPLHDSKFFF